MDGVGDAIDGTVEEIADFLFERLNKQAEGGEVSISTETRMNTNTCSYTNIHLQIHMLIQTNTNKSRWR